MPRSRFVATVVHFFLFLLSLFGWLYYNISRNYYKISSLRFVDGGTEELDV
jgi:hypothetical protein